ncbi:MAG TPA: hypothetical protein DEA08_39045, partial [Planctomycetes bacterium]|nr:hypothetical protein [Planctomycetota bacterium]
LERFRREARAVANLKHPNIVQALAIEESQGLLYMAMDFVPGVAMDNLTNQGALSANEIVGVVAKIAHGLHYAHGQGIIHRDVKPANILYRADTGVAKLTDFGLAKRIGISAGTRDGEGVGTPCYMPPEQVNNARNVDHRADVY